MILNNKEIQTNCSGSKWKKIKSAVKDHLLMILTLGCAIAGFGVGFAIRSSQPTPATLTWIGLPGQLWMRALKLLILPLIVSSVTIGAASLDPMSNGKISLVAFIFIVSSNVLGSAIGVFLAVVMKPGHGMVTSYENVRTENVGTVDIFIDLLRNIFSDNILDIAISRTQTKHMEHLEIVYTNISNETVQELVTNLQKTVGKTPGPNMLGIVLICFLIGTVAGLCKEKTRPLIELAAALECIFVRLLRYLIYATPIAVLSLITVPIAGTEGLSNVFIHLGVFVGVVTIGLGIQKLVIIPLVYVWFTRRNPLVYYKHICRAWTISCAAASTVSALPETFIALEKGQHIDPRISRFVVPFSIGMAAPGSAVFISSAITFIANISGVQLSVVNLLIVGLLTSMSVMALPAVPSASIAVIVIILTSVNVPTEGISLLFAVEWLLDRLRTGCNLIHHSTCAVITYQICRRNLAQEDLERDINEHSVEATGKENKIKDNSDPEFNLIQRQDSSLVLAFD